MAEGNVVGSAEFELRATRKKLADDLRQSERDVKGFMDRVENDADRSSKSIGNSFGGMVRSLTVGITALTAVFAAGLAMALKFGQADLLSEEQAARAKLEINARLNAERLSAQDQFYGTLAGLANSSNKELAAIGKAAAMAQATIDGVLAVQKALASAPPPMNFALAAAAGVAAAVNVAKIAGVGFADGGYTGDGGKYEPAGVVHRGEFVFSKQAVSRIGVARLQALHSGLKGYAEGGPVGISLPSFAPAIGGLAAVGAGRSAEPIVFDMRGAFVPEAFMREVEQKVAAGEARAYGRAMNDAPKLTMSQTARQQRQAVGRQRRGS